MSNSFYLIKVIELPSVWERASYSACHLKFYFLLRYVSFPLTRDFIWPVPEVSCIDNLFIIYLFLKRNSIFET